VQNHKLTFLKKECLQNFTPSKDFSLSFYFHGVAINFFSDSKSLIQELTEYLPKDWIRKTESTLTHSIYHCSLPMDSREWEDESSSEILESDHTIIQRDFACIHKGEATYTFFHHEISDGLHNFFRYFLAQKLIAIDKAILHCASVVDNGLAYIFLGPSGAGKTTTTSLLSDKTILGDDMNLITLEGDKLFCSPGGVGGLYKPDVAINEKFPVAGIYWLKQDTSHFIKENSQSEKMKMLFASIANISWDELSPKLTQKIWSLSEKVCECSSIQTLHFKKDNSFWSLITGK